MKYILLVLLVLWSVFSSVFAQSITLTSTTNSLDINTTFWLTVQVDGLSNPWEVQIQWVDKFVVRGQAQSTSMQLTNWQQSLQIQLQLQLQPTASGSFVLWPARITVGSGVVESNSLTIQVTGEKLFLQPQQANALLGVQENVAPENDENKELPAEPKSNPSLWWIVLVLLMGLVGWLVYSKKNKPISTLSSPQTVLWSEKKYLLPEETDELFREHMELRWRDQLQQGTMEDCTAATYSELRARSQHLSPHNQEVFLSACMFLEQARYAGEQENRAKILELAKHFITL